MQWSFQPVGGWLLTGLVVAVLAALVWVVPQPRPSGGKLAALRALRAAVVLLVLLALARPTLLRTIDQPVEASLVLLVDESRSMQVEDSLADASRWAALKRMLGDSAAAIDRLDDLWTVRAYRFSGEVDEIEIEGGRLKLPDEPTGDATGVGAALAEVLERGGGERLLGVVLMSDGANRALPPRDTPPQLAARRLAAEQAPLFTVAFGTPSSGDRADLAIEDLAASESAFVKAPTEVSGVLRAAGFAGRRLTVQLLWEDSAGEMQVVAAQSVEAAAGRSAVPFRLTHTPTEPGERKLTVRVEPADGELITGNNQQSTFISVREGGLKVLYLVGTQRIGGVPGLEQRFVRSSLAASPDIAVTRRVYDYRQRLQPLPQELNATADGERAATAPDVVILDDLDATALSADAWQAIADEVARGMGLAMLGGRHSFGPGGYRGSAIAEALPIGLGPAERQAFGEPLRRDVHVPGPTTMKLTPQGERSPILNLTAGADRAWPKLPALDGANRLDRRRVKLNATILAESAGPSAWPLLIVGQSGEGRVMALAVDSTFRWRLEGEQAAREAHRRFWRQVVLWLARKDDTTQDPVWIKLDSRRVARGGRLDLRVGLRPGVDVDPQTAEFVATVRTPDGRETPLPLGVLNSAGEAAALFVDTAAPGDYTAKVVATVGGEEIGAAEARFSVPDEDLELDNPAAEPSQMAQLAAATSAAGGRALAPEELPALLKEFADRPPELREEVLSRITYWDTWPFFLLLVGLLSVEWWLRKRWGLV
ncbi:MAG: glutamine amidotransferase [Planctomycetota bacterium]